MKRYLTPLTLVDFPKSWHQANREATLPAGASTWVHLIALPDPFSYDQALLLSRQSEDEWLAWVPDYGEIILHVGEFYLSHDWN